MDNLQSYGIFNPTFPRVSLPQGTVFLTSLEADSSPPTAVGQLRMTSLAKTSPFSQLNCSVVGPSGELEWVPVLPYEQLSSPADDLPWVGSEG